MLAGSGPVPVTAGCGRRLTRQFPYGFFQRGECPAQVGNRRFDAGLQGARETIPGLLWLWMHNDGRKRVGVW